MEWQEKHIKALEEINPIKLSPNQMGFYNTMKRFAMMGVIPSPKLIQTDRKFKLVDATMMQRCQTQKTY